MYKSIMNVRVFLLSILTFKTAYCGFAKKYKLEVQTVTPCPQNEQLESPMRNLQFKKINTTCGILSYDISYIRPLDESVGVDMKMEKWTEKGWTSLPIIPFQKDVCRSMLNSPLMRDMWIHWGTQMKVPEPDKCPIPPGNYSMKGALLNMGLVEKIPFWSGQYRIFISEKLVKDKSKEIYCIQLNFLSKEVV